MAATGSCQEEAARLGSWAVYVSGGLKTPGGLPESLRLVDSCQVSVISFL